jgi:hypothetical protein
MISITTVELANTLNVLTLVAATYHVAGEYYEE